MSRAPKKRKRRSKSNSARPADEQQPETSVRRFGLSTRRVVLILGISLLAATGGILFRSPPSSFREPSQAGSVEMSVPEVDPFCGVTSTGVEDIPAGSQPAGTRRMIARLNQSRIEGNENPTEGAYLSNELVEYFIEELEENDDPNQDVHLRFNLAINLLRAGQSVAALEAFESLEMDTKARGLNFNPAQVKQLRRYRALCWLRMGEQENCLANHTSESCLVPIQGDGVHTLPRGSRGAINLLEEQLAQDPSDLTSVWLLNVAYMTLGQYPDRVPLVWRIPPEAFESDYDIQPFPDVASKVGLNVDGLAGGTIMEDFNRDGYLDMMVSDWSLSGPLRFFVNRRDGTFAEQTRKAGLDGMVGGLNLIQTDYNNDGWPDVFVLRGAWLAGAGHHANSLLRNNGDGTFEDVTEQVGLLSLHPTQSAAWLDYDGDGWLDLFIGNESSGTEVHPCELYHNNGGVTFTECAHASGVAVTQFVKGVTSGDYDNDGRPDLFLSIMNGANMLLHNDGPPSAGAAPAGTWRFRNVAADAGVTSPGPSFPTWFFDYDNDGWLDLFVSDYGGNTADVLADYIGRRRTPVRARLYRNNHDGTFADVSRETGLDKVLLAMGANYGDLDNDGWLDFYVGTGDPGLSTVIPNRMFRNNGGKVFQDVTTSGGFGHIQKGHGVGFGDWDNDGDQDVFINMGGAYSGDTYRSSLFLNPGHGNHWVTLKLQGVRSNRAALGARIRIEVETPEGRRFIYKTVSSGGSFGSSPLRQEIGLGPATSIRRVDILWPATGRTQQVKGVALDRFYKIREDDPVAKDWKLHPVRIPSGSDSPATKPLS